LSCGRLERRQRPDLFAARSANLKPMALVAWQAFWVGLYCRMLHTLAIGEEVRLRITDPMPRCVMTTLPQGDLPRDLGILHTVAQHNQVGIPILGGEARPSVGVCAFVLQGGTIRRGDPVRIA
jgi:uncharacterized protein YcbX